MRAVFAVDQPEPPSVSLDTLMHIFAEGVKYTGTHNEKDVQSIWVDTYIKWLVHSNNSVNSKS